MNILVFGTGGSSVGIEHECALYGFNIVAYLDNDQKKWNTEREGKPILPPTAATKLSFDRIVTATALFHEEMRQQLIQFGIPDGKIFATRSGSNNWIEGCNSLIYRRHSVEAPSKKLRTEIVSFEVGEKALDNVPSLSNASDHAALVEKLWNALEAAERDIKDAPAPYQAGANWQNFLMSTRPEFFEARRTKNIKQLDELLANFCRNDMSTGILGGRAAFDSYAAQPGMVNGIRQNFNVWAYSIGDAPVHELASPPIGNPFGHWIEGGIVHPNTFLNHYRGRFTQKLLGNVKRPVIAEIGGGFGGYAYYALKFIPDCCYINFDLPENLIISSYYLSLAYPDLRIHLYSGKEDMQSLIDNYDIILMPQFALPWLPDRSVDFFINTISLSEMDYATICEYLHQIARSCDGYFYHENMISNGTGYSFYPIDTFPALPDFQELTRQPSRWPFFSASSLQHCHIEQLFIRKSRIQIGDCAK
ncbi:MAG: putative sugar O-methyltransferase [Pseudomonadota bacterium]